MVVYIIYSIYIYIYIYIYILYGGGGPPGPKNARADFLSQSSPAGKAHISVTVLGPFDLHNCTYCICNRPWQRVSHPSQDSSQFGSSTLASFDMHILCIIYEINNQILFGYFGCADVRSGTAHAFLMSVQSCPIVAVTSEATCFTVSANQ